MKWLGIVSLLVGCGVIAFQMWGQSDFFLDNAGSFRRTDSGFQPIKNEKLATSAKELFKLKKTEHAMDTCIHRWVGRDNESAYMVYVCAKVELFEPPMVTLKHKNFVPVRYKVSDDGNAVVDMTEGHDRGNIGTFKQIFTADAYKKAEYSHLIPVENLKPEFIQMARDRQKDVGY